jgi:rhodanese-related sulfurtransferase
MAVDEVTVEELEELLPGARLVDVREPYEFDEAHVPGAVLVPMASVPDRLDAFAPDAPTYVICQTGARSLRVCEYLEAQGLVGINVYGGTRAWLLSGREPATGYA